MSKSDVALLVQDKKSLSVMFKRLKFSKAAGGPVKIELLARVTCYNSMLGLGAH